MANDGKKIQWGPRSPEELLEDARKGREARLWLDSANAANKKEKEFRISEENRIKTEVENKNIASDLASLNPIGKPGSTPTTQGELQNIGTRIPEINPTTEYGGLTIRPIATKKTATANKMTAVRAPKPPVNLNTSGPKAMEEINTGWIQEDGAPLQYRQYTPTVDKTETRQEKRAKRKATKKNIN